MAKKIKLELTEAQFYALMGLAEETVIIAGGSDYEHSSLANRRANLVNKALKNSGIDYELNG